MACTQIASDRAEVQKSDGIGEYAHPCCRHIAAVLVVAAFCKSEIVDLACRQERAAHAVVLAAVLSSRPTALSSHPRASALTA